MVRGIQVGQFSVGGVGQFSIGANTLSKAELKKLTIQISPVQDALSFDEIDLQIYIPGLLGDLYGPQIFAEAGRVGGKRSTPRKTAAARENGRKGGRPRKSIESDAA